MADENCDACGMTITEDDERVRVYPKGSVDDLGTEAHQEFVDDAVVLYVHREHFDPARYEYAGTPPERP